MEPAALTLAELKHRWFEAMVEKQMRAIWPLIKARVVERSESQIKISIGGSTTITISHDMRMYDVREGDLLTLYTEVLIAKPEGTA